MKLCENRRGGMTRERFKEDKGGEKKKDEYGRIDPYLTAAALWGICRCAGIRSLDHNNPDQFASADGG